MPLSLRDKRHLAGGEGAVTNLMPLSLRDKRHLAGGEGRGASFRPFGPKPRFMKLLRSFAASQLAASPEASLQDKDSRTTTRGEGRGLKTLAIANHHLTCYSYSNNHHPEKQQTLSRFQPKPNHQKISRPAKKPSRVVPRPKSRPRTHDPATHHPEKQQTPHAIPPCRLATFLAGRAGP